MTTIHTVSRTYAMEVYHAYVVQLAVMSHKLTVMTELMRWTLDSFHGVAPHSVAVIPHGVPDRRPLARRTQGTMHQSIFPGKRVIMTNGLIHGFKGIEYMIAAMPAVSSRSKVTPRVCVESDGWRVEKRRGSSECRVLCN